MTMAAHTICFNLGYCRKPSRIGQNSCRVSAVTHSLVQATKLRQNWFARKCFNLEVYKKVFPKPLNTLMTPSTVGVSNKLQHYLIYNSCFLDILFSSKVLSANSPDEWEGTKLINVLLPSWRILGKKKYATIFAQEWMTEAAFSHSAEA